MYITPRPSNRNHDQMNLLNGITKEHLCSYLSTDNNSNDFY